MKKNYDEKKMVNEVKKENENLIQELEKAVLDAHNAHKEIVNSYKKEIKQRDRIITGLGVALGITAAVGGYNIYKSMDK